MAFDSNSKTQQSPSKHIFQKTLVPFRKPIISHNKNTHLSEPEHSKLIINSSTTDATESNLETPQEHHKQQQRALFPSNRRHHHQNHRQQQHLPLPITQNQITQSNNDTAPSAPKGSVNYNSTMPCIPRSTKSDKPVQNSRTTPYPSPASSAFHQTSYSTSNTSNTAHEYTLSTPQNGGRRFIDMSSILLFNSYLQAHQIPEINSRTSRRAARRHRVTLHPTAKQTMQLDPPNTASNEGQFLDTASESSISGSDDHCELQTQQIPQIQTKTHTQTQIQKQTQIQTQTQREAQKQTQTNDPHISPIAQQQYLVPTITATDVGPLPVAPNGPHPSFEGILTPPHTEDDSEEDSAADSDSDDSISESWFDVTDGYQNDLLSDQDVRTQRSCSAPPCDVPEHAETRLNWLLPVHTPSPVSLEGSASFEGSAQNMSPQTSTCSSDEKEDDIENYCIRYEDSKMADRIGIGPRR